jgi:O-antigen ligase
MGPLSFFIIGTMPILFAAVQPWVWSMYCLLMIAAFILFLWTRQDSSGISRGGYLTKTVAIFFIWTLFLCLPLPYPVLSLLSPTQSEILVQAWALTDSTPGWEAISYSSRKALSWWVFLVSLGLFFRVVRHLCLEIKTLKRMVFVMIGIGLIEAAYGLVQTLVPSMGVLWVDFVRDYLGTARGTFINRNHFAGFMEMIWPLALGINLAHTGRVRSLKEVLGSDRLNRQALMALGVIVLLLALIFTRSRAGIFSGLIGFLAFFIMARTGMKDAGLQNRFLFGGITVLMCVYTITIGVEPILDRFLIIGDASYSRLDIWRDSLPIIKNHPLGIGLGNYENVFAVYNQSFIAGKTVTHAHNDYLQLLIETGWVGFLAAVSGFFVFLGKSAGRIKRLDFRRNPLRFYLAIGAFSGLISMAAHSIFDFNLQIPANCMYFVVLLAVLSACTQPRTPKLHKQQSKIDPK